MVMIGSRTLEKLRFCSLSLQASADGSMAGLILNRGLLLTCVLTLTLVSKLMTDILVKPRYIQSSFKCL